MYALSWRHGRLCGRGRDRAEDWCRERAASLPSLSWLVGVCWSLAVVAGARGRMSTRSRRSWRSRRLSPVSLVVPVRRARVGLGIVHRVHARGGVSGPGAQRAGCCRCSPRSCRRAQAADARRTPSRSTSSACLAPVAGRREPDPGALAAHHTDRPVSILRGRGGACVDLILNFVIVAAYQQHVSRQPERSESAGLRASTRPSIAVEHRRSPSPAPRSTSRSGCGGIAFALAAVFAFSYMAHLLEQSRHRSEQYVSLSWGVLAGLMRSLDIRDRAGRAPRGGRGAVRAGHGASRSG